MFIGCMIVLSLACVGLALVPTDAYWLLMVLRCLQAAGSASTIALGRYISHTSKFLRCLRETLQALGSSQTSPHPLSVAASSACGTSDRWWDPVSGQC